MERADGAALPLDSGLARWTLVASILGSSMAFIDSSVVNVALPSIQADLGGGLATQQWVVDAYLLTLGSLILVGGSLGDIFGESRVFAIGVATFAGASLLCAIAPTAPALIVFRAIQGMAGAILTPASLAMITATFSGTARGNAIGQWTSWTGISFIVGPTLGGWLVDVSSWRVIFLLNLPIAAGTLLLVLRLGGMRQKRREDMKVDVVGRDPLHGRARPARRRLHRAAAARLERSAHSRRVRRRRRACSGPSSCTSCGRRCRCCRSGCSGCGTSRSRTSRRSRSTAVSRR